MALRRYSLPAVFVHERWMSPGGYTGSCRTAEQEDALATMLMTGNLQGLLSKSLDPNWELTEYLGSYRSGHSLRTSRSQQARDRHDDTHLGGRAAATASTRRRRSPAARARRASTMLAASTCAESGQVPCPLESRSSSSARARKARGRRRKPTVKT